MLDYNMECKMIQKQHRQHVININIKKLQTDHSFQDSNPWFQERMKLGSGHVYTCTCTKQTM